MSEEHRRSLRKRANAVIEVNDAITARVIGRIGNLSNDGMLVITPKTLPAGALYMFHFSLPENNDAHRQLAEASRIEIGVQEQWGEEAKVPGQFWTGFRIIDISPEDQRRLTHWVDSTRD